MKKMIVFVMLLLLSTPISTQSTNQQTSALTVSANSIVGSPAADATIVPMADVIVWKYKSINGHVYRRRYNSTKRVWIGEWELCP